MVKIPHSSPTQGVPKYCRLWGILWMRAFKCLLGALVRNLDPQGYLRNNVLRKFFQKNNNAGFSRQTPKFLCLSIASLEIWVSRLSYESRIIYFSKNFIDGFCKYPCRSSDSLTTGAALLKASASSKSIQNRCKCISVRTRSPRPYVGWH